MNAKKKKKMYTNRLNQMLTKKTVRCTEQRVGQLEKQPDVLKTMP